MEPKKKYKIGVYIDYVGDSMSHVENRRIIATRKSPGDFKIVEYLIEHPNGWIPYPYAVQKYKISPLKNYIFVRDNEIILSNI